MKIIQALIALALMSAPALAQVQEGKDIAKPQDGAIKGGAIVPGESAGTPDSRGTASPSARGVQRCNELTGTLREQCLEQERNAGTGTTRSTDPAAVPTPRAPGEPPPQNPR